MNKKINQHELGQRVLIGAVILALISVGAIANDKYLLAIALIVSSISIYELNKALGKISRRSLIGLLQAFNIIFIVFAYMKARNIDLILFRNITTSSITLTHLVIFYVLLIVIASFTVRKKLLRSITTVLSTTLLTVLGTIYITLPFAYLVAFTNVKHLVMIFITTTMTDSVAYLMGKMVGKTKVSVLKNISPNKTLEGFLGGMLSSIITGFALYTAFNIKMGLGSFILFMMGLAILSQVGDLLASAIKRIIGIKDFSNILGPHGGVLDRFDSILLLPQVVRYFMPHL